MRDGQGWAMGLTAKIGGQGRAMGRGRAREVGWRRGVGGGGAVREAQEFSRGQALRGKGGKGGGRAGEVPPHWDGRGVTVWGGGRVSPPNPRHPKRRKKWVENGAVEDRKEGREIEKTGTRGVVPLVFSAARGFPLFGPLRRARGAAAPLGLLQPPGALPFLV